MKQHYRPTAEHVWEGRIDDPADPDAFRWHQVVQLIDPTSPDIKPLSQGQMGFCFLGFSYFCLGIQTYGNTRSLFKTAKLTKKIQAVFFLFTSYSTSTSLKLLKTNRNV